jgi:hypothetical protein
MEAGRQEWGRIGSGSDLEFRQDREDGGGGVARDEVRAAATGSHRLPGARGRTIESGDDPRQLRPHGHRLGRPGSRPVPAHAGVVLPSDPLRPTRHRRLRPRAAGAPAALGVLCRGPGRGPGPGRRGTDRGHGGLRCRPDGHVLCRDQAATDQRAHPGQHHGQVGGRRQLPHRDPPPGCRGAHRRGRASLGHRGPGRDVCAEPSRRPAVLPLVCEAAADHRQPQHRGGLPGGPSWRSTRARCCH